MMLTHTHSKPGFWDMTDGTYRTHTTPFGMVSGDRSRDPTDEAARPKHPLPRQSVIIPAAFQGGQGWKPMSAAKIREAAKQDCIEKKTDVQEDGGDGQRGRQCDRMEGSVR